jgi:hypothetical protein
MNEGGRKDLSVALVWSDDHMIEVECRLAFADCSGVACVYTTLADVQGFAKKLRSCVILPWTAEWRMGEGIAIRFNSVDHAGHIACQIHLATSANTGHRPEQVWKLSAEMEVYPAQILTFANDLAHMLVMGNKAVLHGRILEAPDGER